MLSNDFHKKQTFFGTIKSGTRFLGRNFRYFRGSALRVILVISVITSIFQTITDTFMIEALNHDYTRSMYAALFVLIISIIVWTIATSYLTSFSFSLTRYYSEHGGFDRVLAYKDLNHGLKQNTWKVASLFLISVIFSLVVYFLLMISPAIMSFFLLLIFICPAIFVAYSLAAIPVYLNGKTTLKKALKSVTLKQFGVAVLQIVTLISLLFIQQTLCMVIFEMPKMWIAIILFVIIWMLMYFIELWMAVILSLQYPYNDKIE